VRPDILVCSAINMYSSSTRACLEPLSDLEILSVSSTLSLLMYPSTSPACDGFRSVPPYTYDFYILYFCQLTN